MNTDLQEFFLRVTMEKEYPRTAGSIIYPVGLSVYQRVLKRRVRESPGRSLAVMLSTAALLVYISGQMMNLRSVVTCFQFTLLSSPWLRLPFPRISAFLLE